MQADGNTRDLLGPAAASANNQLQVVHDNQLVAVHHGHCSDVGHRHARRRNDLHRRLGQRPGNLAQVLGVSGPDGPALDVPHRDLRRGSHKTVCDLVLVGFQRKKADLVSLGPVSGALQRPGGLAGGWAPAENDKIPRLGIEPVIKLLDGPAEILGLGGLPLVKPLEQLAHGVHSDAGPVHCGPVGLGHQRLQLVQIRLRRHLLPKLPELGGPGLFPGQLEVIAHVRRRRRDLHQLDQKLVVILPQLPGHGHRVHRLTGQKQIPDDLVHRPAGALEICLPGLLQHLGHDLRRDQHGAQDAVLRVQPLVARHSQSPSRRSAAGGASAA